MPMRLSGLMSGMDTESIISQLVEARKTKVTKAVKAQKSLKFKQDAWKDLNKKIVNLYNKSLTQLRFEGSYVKKTTKVSNSSVVSVITGENAMNSVQSLEVLDLAQSAYLTGGKINGTGKTDDAKEITDKTKLSDLGFTGSGSFRVKTTEGVTNITLDENSTVGNFISTLRKAGLNANFDQTYGRIHITSKSSGEDNDFSLIANDANGLRALQKLGLSYSNSAVKEHYESILGITTGTSVTVDETFILNKIAKDQADYLQNRKDRKAELETEITGLKATQFTQFGDIKDVLTTDTVAKAAWEKALQDAGKTSADFDVAGTFNADEYNKLSDEDKKIFNDALNKALDAAKANGTITSEKKEKLEKLQSDWSSNDSKLSRAEASLEAVKKELTDDGSDLSVDAKAAIEKKIRDAAEAYNTLDASAAASGATKTAGKNSHIKLNGVDYYSSKNTLEVNGLTLTVSARTNGDPVTITTEDDTNGIYDMIKNFFKEYNAVINEMDKYYNADAAKGYDPLTDEEKAAMSDSQIEEWENKIKDSILRKDSTLSTFAGAMKQIMMEGVEVNGKKMYLANFGIGTLNYFSAPDNERNAYHIDGDPDDENTANNADKLKSMIANDPDTVVSFFTQLSQKLSDKMFDLMKGKEGYSSAMTVYDDKKMQKDYDDYTAKIKDLEKKLADYEDKWYAKFAAMETALAKMQNNASAVTSLLGG